MSDEWIDPEEVSRMSKLSEGALAQRRYMGLPPTFYKPTPRRVLYKRSEVLEWIEGSARTSTADPIPA